VEKAEGIVWGFHPKFLSPGKRGFDRWETGHRELKGKESRTLNKESHYAI